MKVNGSHHGDSPLLKTKRIQIATKSYNNNQVQTIRKHWASENIEYSFSHKDDVVFMSLGANYRLFLLYRVCCPSTKVIKTTRNYFSAAIEILHEDKLCHTSQEMVYRSMSKWFIKLPCLLHIESNLHRLGFLSPTRGQCFQQRSGQTTLQCVSQHQTVAPRWLS